VMLGTGICTEDYSSHRYWKRPNLRIEKEVQVGTDLYITQISENQENSLSLNQWEESLIRLPQENFRVATECSLHQAIIEAYNSVGWTIAARLAIACKVMHINRAHASRAGPVEIIHDHKLMKSRTKRFTKSLIAISEDIINLRSARNKAF